MSNSKSHKQLDYSVSNEDSQGQEKEELKVRQGDLGDTDADHMHMDSEAHEAAPASESDVTAEQASEQTSEQTESLPATNSTGELESTESDKNEDERPLNQPKGNRPPRKTREERGLPPLDENGNPPEAPVEKSMTLMEHLSELRTRLVRSFIAIGLAFVVCYTFAEPLFAELCKPLVAALPEGSKLIFTALPEAFFVYVKVGFVAALFAVSPYIFYQIWEFISPGLYEEEKKYMIPMALISAIFFYSGAAFCFFVVFPYAFTFFVGFASEQIAAMPSLNEYLAFALKLLLAFGLIFEMPLFTFFLARMGVLTATMMRKARRYAILCIFILAAILTPPDVISQVLMAVPMMILYEGSIGVAAVFGRKKKSEAAETQTDEDAEKENAAQSSQRNDAAGKNTDDNENSSESSHTA